MADVIDMTASAIDRFPGPFASNPVTDELTRIMALLRDACPPETLVSFSFDGRLQAHIDVRKREHVMFVEMVLPTLEDGLFHNVSLGGTPRHPFYHRVSAQVRG
jgi:hypothetical protein